MNLATLVDTYKASADPARQQAFATAYIPIVRSFLLPGAAYYVYITSRHWVDETGMNLIILGSLSALTAMIFVALRYYLSSERLVSLKRLELAGFSANMLIYLNVTIYFLINFEETKLVYFAMMAVVFSTTGVTLRITFTSVLLSLMTLYFFASGLPSELFDQYVSIGIATAVAAFGMASLLRKAILRQIDARLLADKLASRAQRLADTDVLTGVPNRRAVFEKIDYLVSQGKPFWMGIFDLDGFKAINDVYGHSMGDRLLCAIVDRAIEINVEGAKFGRIGGDEFLAILPGTRSEEEIKHIGKHTIEAISRPYPIDLLDLTVGASAGFAHFPTMGSSSAQLYEKQISRCTRPKPIDAVIALSSTPAKTRR
jgi:diguanylate cyclase (GGDEF)-like protein